MRPICEKKILHVNRENYELGSRISRFNRALFIYNEVIMDMYLWICIYADVAVLHPIQLLIIPCCRCVVYRAEIPAYTYLSFYKHFILETLSSFLNLFGSSSCSTFSLERVERVEIHL